MKVLVIGAGGLARETAEWCASEHEVVGFWSENSADESNPLLSSPFHSGEITPEDVGTDQVLMAIGTPEVKARLHNKLSEWGFKFPSFVHPSSVVSELVELSEGSVIGPNCVVSTRVTIGALAYVNFSCGIGHDTVIGDYVQINPGAQIGGWVTIGGKTLVGSGSTILQELQVGSRATVGSGSVCFRSVDDDATVLGNPARRAPGI